MKIAVIGAGITGLTAGWRLSQKNHQVVVLEKEKFPGGLTAGFKKENWQKIGIGLWKIFSTIFLFPIGRLKI